MPRDPGFPLSLPTMSPDCLGEIWVHCGKDLVEVEDSAAVAPFCFGNALDCALKLAIIWSPANRTSKPSPKEIQVCAQHEILQPTMHCIRVGKLSIRYISHSHSIRKVPKYNIPTLYNK